MYDALTFPPEGGWRGVTRELLEAAGFKNSACTSSQWHSFGDEYKSVTFYPDSPNPALREIACVYQRSSGDARDFTPEELVGVLEEWKRWRR